VGTAGLSMQVDLFMEFAAPAFAGKSVGQVFDDGLALASAADRGGFGGIWLAEHHFLKEYSLSSAPEILLAAIARETKKLELGLDYNKVDHQTGLAPYFREVLRLELGKLLNQISSPPSS